MRLPKRIGGTAIGQIVGASNFGGPIDAFRRLYEGYEQPQNKPMRRGRLLEPVAREMYVEDTGANLKPRPDVLYSDRYEFMSASLDDLAIRDGQELVVEYKTANMNMLSKFGPEDSGVFPKQYRTQCAWYMAATGLNHADLAVLLAGDEFRVYRITRDLELESMLLEAAERFWKDHLLTGIPPPPDASEGYAEYLANKFPEDTGPVVVASAEAEGWAEVLRRAKVDLADAEAREQQARNLLMDAIGEAAGMTGDGWKISYRSTKPRSKVDWESVAMAAGATKAQIEANTNEGKSYRTFRATFKEMK